MLEVGVKQPDGSVKYVSVGECEARTPDTCHIPKYGWHAALCVHRHVCAPSQGTRCAS